MRHVYGFGFEAIQYLMCQMTQDKNIGAIKPQPYLHQPNHHCHRVPLSMAKYGNNWCAPLDMNGQFHFNTMADKFGCNHWGDHHIFPYQKYIEIPCVTYDLEEWAKESGVRHDPRYMHFSLKFLQTPVMLV